MATRNALVASKKYFPARETTVAPAREAVKWPCCITLITNNLANARSWVIISVIRPLLMKKPKPTPWQWPPVHPALEKLPMPSDAEIDELARDIKVNGLWEPIAIWVDDREEPHGEGPFPQFLLDGRGRRAALERLGITDPRKAPYASSDRVHPVRYLYASSEKGINPETFVLSMNVYRRHLTSEQKREAIAAFIKADPRASDHAIAKTLHVADRTVSRVRKESVPNSENPKMEHRSVERAKAAVRANPDASVSNIVKAADVGRATAQRARKLVVAEPKTEPKSDSLSQLIAAEEDMKKKAERFRAAVHKTFASWMEQWLEEIGIGAMIEIMRDEWTVARS